MSKPIRSDHDDRQQTPNRLPSLGEMISVVDEAISKTAPAIKHDARSEIAREAGRRIFYWLCPPPPAVPKPKRIQLQKVDGIVVVPAGAVRVDRGSSWKPPFWTDHRLIDTRIMMNNRIVDCFGNRMLFLAEMFRDWITGRLADWPEWQIVPRDKFMPHPPTPLAHIRAGLAGKDLADWAPLGQPCIGDVLLALANQREDGTLYPTASDGMGPRLRSANIVLGSHAARRTRR